ncbi:hypothetical protein [Bacillus badius]|nr:hypothetical protein [Bacillus badius]KZN99316.1 hypothetical protein A4244_05615 [Bacillus badius]KZR59160.1 hypothetical protein A3781_14335 [Bacillus badius]MED0668594.1 hypothetical protein [Bacillus badius]MED4717149.1 hypothetical protein [Bacillus badius]OCS84797.1 hypothetical protein A6M11_05620 [Bacillus badius]
MKSGKKITILVGLTLLIGIGAVVLFYNFKDDTRGYQNYQTEADLKTTTSNSTTLNQNSTTPSSSNSPFIGVEGKVMELTEDNITIGVPLQGTKTFTINKSTKVEDLFSPLKKGVLADINANGELAYHIETENTVDAYGMIVKITDKDVTIDYNGNQETFVKASNFRMDTEGYRGTLEGLTAEITLNSQFQIIDLETDLDYEDDDD